MMVPLSVTDNERNTVLFNTQKEAACGDMCAWCGECIVCAKPPVHATEWRLAHAHYLAWTEKEAKEKGIDLP